jgi:hypothetical protein
VNDHFRASDADRDRVAAVLRGHCAAGDLTPEELDARLTATLSARTVAELGRVLVDLAAPGPVLPPAGRGLPPAGRLERRYRRLMFLYPAWYRRVHEEEMLAVLMTAAPAGTDRAGVADAADLLWGAVRVRLQPQRRDGQPAWRDALAALSVILPVIMLVIFAKQEITRSLAYSPVGLHGSDFPLWPLRQIAAPAALAALVLLRLRVAAIMAAAVVFLFVLLTGESYLIYATANAGVLVPLGLEIVALAASSGPRRGRQVVTWKHGALAATGALAASIVGYPAMLIVVAVAAAAMALASSLGRWLLVLLTIAAWPAIMFAAFGPFMGTASFLPYGPAVVSQVYLLPAVLLALFAVAALSESRRPALLSLAARRARS